MTEKKAISPAAGATAAMFSVVGLVQALARKNLLTPDECNEAFATAASMCRANRVEEAAEMIELIVPTSKGIDVAELARKRGEKIERPGEE